MNTVETRSRRASAAHLLLAVYTESGRAVPEIWTWQRLDALPDWSLLDRRDREVLQRVCGAVLMAPLLRLCIDGERIGSARMALGSIPYESVIDSAPPTFDVDRVPAALADLDRWLVGACRNDIDAALLSAGASVLIAGIVDPLLRDELSRTLMVDLDEQAASAPVSWKSLPPSAAVEVLRLATLCMYPSNDVALGDRTAEVSTPEPVAPGDRMPQESTLDHTAAS